MELNVDVLGCGNPLWDHFAQVELKDSFINKYSLIRNSTAPGSKQQVVQAWADLGLEEVKPTPGGSATNMMKTLTGLNQTVRCAICGKISKNDTEMPKYLSDLNVVPLLGLGEQETGTVNCFIDKITRTLQTFFGTANELSPADFRDEYFHDGLKYVVIEGYLAYAENVLETIVAKTKALCQAKIIIDLSSVAVVDSCRKVFEKVIPDADIIVGNKDEMYALTGEAPIQAAKSSLFSRKQTVFVTQGEDGGYFREGGQSVVEHWEAIKVDLSRIKDTTGAGDGFIAGCVEGLLRKKSLKQCAWQGSLVAAEVIQCIGTNLPKGKLTTLARTFEGA